MVLSIGDFVYFSDPDLPLNQQDFGIAKIMNLYEITAPLSSVYKCQASGEAYRR